MNHTPANGFNDKDFTLQRLLLDAVQHKGHPTFLWLAFWDGSPTLKLDMGRGWPEASIRAALDRYWDALSGAALFEGKA